MTTAPPLPPHEIVRTLLSDAMGYTVISSLVGRPEGRDILVSTLCVDLQRQRLPLELYRLTVTPPPQGRGVVAQHRAAPTSMLCIDAAGHWVGFDFNVSQPGGIAPTVFDTLGAALASLRWRAQAEAPDAPGDSGDWVAEHEHLREMEWSPPLSQALAARVGELTSPWRAARLDAALPAAPAPRPSRL